MGRGLLIIAVMFLAMIALAYFVGVPAAIRGKAKRHRARRETEKVLQAERWRRTRPTLAQRDAAIEVVKQAYVNGQINQEEVDALIERVLGVRTNGGLSDMTRNLEVVERPH